MINFPRSSFTRKAHAWEHDDNYRFAGGFVGTPGQSYHVRFSLEAALAVTHLENGTAAELYVGAPCRTEYTIANRNLFQVPSGEYRMAFSRSARVRLAKRPSGESEEAIAAALDTEFESHRIDLRGFARSNRCTDGAEVVAATLAGDLLNAECKYEQDGFEVRTEFPVNLINLDEEQKAFQVCTGPVLLPDLGSWDGRQPARVFLGHAAFSAFDQVEFILRRQVEAAQSERVWLDAPRGRDRFELWDPSKPPSGYPPRRPCPYVYNETWERAADNAILRAANDAPPP